MTRFIVLLKDIPDLTEIKFDHDTRAPITQNVKRRISDLDKRALEAAIRLKEAHGGEVVALSLGDDRTRTALLEALAMGADAAYVVNDPELQWLDTNATSRVLEAAVREIGGYGLILTGEMTLDGLGSQIGPRLAELLDLPQVTYVRELGLDGETLKAVRDLEDVDEAVEVELPAVVSVVREVNEPRIPSLINIMRAKKKPTTVWEAGDLGLSAEELRASSFIELLEVRAPEVARKRIAIEAESVEAAARKLAEAIISEGVLEG